MAKVKNQVYDGSEESYTDEGGDAHYIGLMIWGAMTDEYPLPSTGDTGVVRKTPRGYKPTEQGRGSPDQAPYRECWQQCADKWNALPDDCSGRQPCLGQSSKETMFGAKQDQGVMCSYFDLFMAACMSTCASIEVTGPDGVSFKSGLIPEGESNFPCSPPAEESSVDVGFTTQTMGPNQTQALTLIDPDTGLPSNYGDVDEIIWSVITPGGGESFANGLVVDYNSPGENPNCAENNTVEVLDECGREASINIAVNTYPDENEIAATECYDVVIGGTSYHCQNWITCGGTIICYPGFSGCVCATPEGYCGSCFTLYSNSCASLGFVEGMNDTRSAEAKLAGCCPIQLF